MDLKKYGRSELGDKLRNELVLSKTGDERTMLGTNRKESELVWTYRLEEK